MPDTQPTATVAGQSIALHITGYPDIPNRWGSGHIRPISIRLDYGNSRTPNGRHALVTGLWVREDGQATDDPVDRLYDAHNGDMSGWPGWLAELVKAHDPAAVPVSSPPPDQTTLHDRIAKAPTDWTDGHPQLEAIAAAVWEHCEHSGSGLVIDDPRNIAVVALNAVLAVLPPAADRAAVYRDAADTVEAMNEGCGQRKPCASCDARTDAADALRDIARRLAAEAQSGCPACGHLTCMGGRPCGVISTERGELPEPCGCTGVEAQQPEAHPPIHAWRVETRDPLADQWAPGSHFAHRPNALERLDTANRTAPLWNDGTPVERRIVRETTTYAVEEQPPTAPSPESGRV